MKEKTRKSTIDFYPHYRDYVDLNNKLGINFIVLDQLTKAIIVCKISVKLAYNTTRKSK